MRLLIQRVSEARVDAAGKTVASIGHGLLALVGFGAGDGMDLAASKVWRTMLTKVPDLRIFPDEAGKLNLSVRDTGGEVLLVSQFTLYADCKKGRRPSFHLAAPRDVALHLFDAFARDMELLLPGRVLRGAYGEEMDVSLCNQGPVTVMLDSADF